MADAAPARPRKTLAETWAETLALFQRRQTLAMVGLGFASGLPLLLVLSTLSVWLRQAGVSRTEIGLLSLALLAYTFKPLWAPLLDRVKLPILHQRFGLRRSWMILAQAAIFFAIMMMALGDPKVDRMHLALWAVVLAFASATLDIAVDAWRVESGTDQEQGPLAAGYQIGYRISNFMAGAIALYIVSFVSGGADPKVDWEAVNAGWAAAYWAMAALCLVGLLAMLFAPEPVRGPQPKPKKGLAGLFSGVIDPFVDFFAREGWLAAVILGFMFISRIGEFFMGPMANPMYVDTGYTPAQIATAAKVIGVWITVVGALAGGIAVARYGVARTLAVGVAMISLPNVVFAWVAMNEPELWRLTSAVAVDNFCNGFGGTVFITYLTAYASRAHAATQYAFLAAWSQLPGRFLAGISGAVIDRLEPTMGTGQAYAVFFVGTALLAVPAVILAVWCARLLERRLAEDALTAPRVAEEEAEDAVPDPGPRPAGSRP
jgi:PAT family beta-lactamase induction signal transducer AmpG